MIRVCVLVASFAFFASVVLAQMPDPRAMSGTPLPVGDLPVGTVTARVIRGQLSNPIQGQAVQVQIVGGAARTETTDGSGRATFSGLAPGARVRLRTTVGTETLESREFAIPTAGGVRVMLVASDAARSEPASASGAPAQAPPVDGRVVLGPQSRFVVEIGEDALNVFNLVQITNRGSRPVRTPGPIVFDLPKGAVGVGLMDGSTPAAVAAGHTVSVAGPFAPGTTLVQFAYSIPLGEDTITIAQRMPAELSQLSLIVQKTPDMQVASPQIAQRREMPAEGGTYVVAQGGAIAAGDTLSLTLSGLPSRPAWPRIVTLTLAAIVLAAGAFAALGRPPAAAGPGRTGRREQLFAELAVLERERRAGAIAADAYARRRESLVTALEDLYRGSDDNVREVA